MFKQNHSRQPVNTAPSPSLHYRPDLQGLRAIAILLVVIAHAELGFFPGGFIGVDIFFVLSGYLITGLLLREYKDTGRIHLSRFYARRFRRLLPALLTMISLILAASVFILSSYEIREQTASAVFASTWTSNLFFAFSTIEYFAELQSQDLFLHTWSLGVEEQFYIVWPISILAILTFLASRRDRTNSNEKLLLIFGGIFLLGLGVSWFLTTINPLWSFYLMPARIWQFALGAGVCVWFNRDECGLGSRKKSCNSAAWSLLLASLGLLAIMASATLLHPGVVYPGYWALLPSSGAALLIASGQNSQDRGINGLLAHPVMTWIGDRSYSWYLWHWPIFILGFPFAVENQLLETLGLVSLSLLFAIVSYRYVELPFWKGRTSRTTPKQAVLLSTLAMFAIVIGIQHGFNNAKNPVATLTHSTPSDAARSDVPIIYAHGCDSWISSADIHPCKYGNLNASRTVVLIGDSIGAQWVSMLFEIFPETNWRIIVLTKSACPIIDEDFFYPRIRKIYDVCTDWRNAAIEYISSVSPDIIFLGNSTTYDFTEPQWVNGLTRILDVFTKINSEVIVIPGTPGLSFDGPSCLERTKTAASELPDGSSFSQCDEIFSSEQYDHVMRNLEKATKDFKNANFINLNDLVCPSKVCSAMTPDGVIVFRDHAHLTDSFVRSRSNDIKNRLEAIGLFDTSYEQSGQGGHL